MLVMGEVKGLETKPNQINLKGTDDYQSLIAKVATRKVTRRVLVSTMLLEEIARALKH